MRMGTSNFVVVANRLPVDRVTGEDGATTWRRSPGGLVTALAPVMRAYDGAWVGWTGSPDDVPEPFSTRHGPGAGPTVRRGDDSLLRGVLERHAVAALPRRRRAPEFHRRVVGRATRRVNRRFAEAAAAGRRQRRRRVGAGLPAPARPARCFASCGRTCGSDSSCTSRSRPANCSCSSRGGARSWKGCSAPTWSGSSAPAPPTNFIGLCARFTACGHRRPGAGRRRADGAGAAPSRSRSTWTRSPGSRGSGRARPLRHRPRRARITRARASRRRPARLHEGDRPPAQGLQRAAGRRRGVVPTTRSSSRWPRPAGNGSRHYQTLRDDIELQVGRINGEYGRIGQPAVHYLHSSYDRAELVALFGPQTSWS